MKKLFFCLLGGAMMLNSCTDDSGVFVPDGIKEPTLPVETKPNEAVKGDVFSKLNLDYPGLEKVKQHYEAGEHYLAAKELLEYYRWRGNVVNPAVPLYVTASAVDINKADQALDYRFCVAKFVETEGDTDDKDVYYSFKNNSDGTINWGYKPDVEGVDREFLYQQHRHQWMEPQAKAYAYTKNEAYFNNWVDVYSSWMAKYPCPNAPFDDPKIYNLEPGYEWKALQPAERVLSQLNIIPCYLNSPNFTPEWLTTVLNAFAESVEMIRMNYISEGNIRATQGQAVVSAGILMPEFKNAEQWVTEGLQTMNMDEQFLSDGVHVDLDLSYHIAAISDYLEVYNLAKANNRLDILPSGYIEKLTNAVSFVKDMIYPNYTIDNFNDTRSRSYAKSTLMNRLKDYLAVFPEDEELKWMAWEGAKGGTKPTWKSKAYDVAGYYMLRSANWGTDNGMMVIHKNNDNSVKEWHCQPDNGTFSLWYKGRNFLPDAGVYSYDDPDATGMRGKYRQYVLHNTMSIYTKNIFFNEKGKPTEKTTTGKMLKHESGSNYELIVTENTPYMAGPLNGDNAVMNGDFKHRRAIYMVDNKFVVLVDEGYSSSVDDGGKKVNLNFHLYSEAGDEPKKIEDLSKPGCNVDGIDAPVKSGDGMSAYAKTKLSGSNLLIKSFVEAKSGFDMKLGKKAEELPVSDNTGTMIGKKRDWLQVHLNIPKNLKNSAARLITVLYPSDGTAGDGSNISAEFTDNAGGTAGTFHPEGAAVKVTVDGQVYELEYTL